MKRLPLVRTASLCSACLTAFWLTMGPGTVASAAPPIHATTVPTGPAITRSLRAHVAGSPQSTQYGAISFPTAQDGFIANGSFLLHTVDGGQSWTKLSTQPFTILDLRFLSPKVGYAIGGEGSTESFVDYHTWVVERTTDGGLRWTTVYRTAASPAQGGTQLDCPSATQILAVLGRAVVATDNSGGSWRTLHIPIAGFMLQSVSFQSGADGYAAGVVSIPAHPFPVHDRALLLHTNDGGAHWTVQYNRLLPSVAGLQVAFLNRSDGWLVTSSTASMTDQLWHTVDGGRHWTILQSDLLRNGDPTGVGAPVFVTPRYGWIPDAMGAMPMQSGVAVTRDGGLHTQLVGARRAWSIRDVALVNITVGYAIAYNINGMFILKTVNGGRTFAQILPDVQPTSAVHFVSASLGYGLGDASNANAFLTTRDGGVSWRIRSSLPGAAVTQPHLTFANAADGWAIARDTEPGRAVSIYRTVDGGRHWTFVARAPGALYTSSEIQSLRFWSPRDGALEVQNGDFEQVWSTTDGGAMWTGQAASRWVVVPVWTDAWASSRVIFGADSRMLYTTGQHRQRANIATQVSSNAGRTWRTLWRQSETVKQLGQFDFINPRDGWITYYTWTKSGNLPLSTILRTTDGAAHWTAYVFPADSVANGFQPGGATIDFVSPATGWMLTQKGLLRTQNGGRNWKWL